MRYRRTYYRTCPHCGELLDPGEHCDCLLKTRDKEAKRTATNMQINRMYESKIEQLTLQCCS